MPAPRQASRRLLLVRLKIEDQYEVRTNSESSFFPSVLTEQVEHGIQKEVKRTCPERPLKRWRTSWPAGCGEPDMKHFIHGSFEETEKE